MQQGQEETVGWERRLLNGKGEREIWDQAIPDQSPLPCAALSSLFLPHLFNSGSEHAAPFAYSFSFRGAAEFTPASVMVGGKVATAPPLPGLPHLSRVSPFFTFCPS